MLHIRLLATLAVLTASLIAVDAARAVNTFLDPSFGNGGKVIVGDGSFYGATAVALQSDGKLVAVGGNRVVRLDSDGTLDGAFGNTGLGVAGATFISAVAILADDRIAIVGTDYSTQSAVVARYQPDGSLDSAFGTDGITTLPLGLGTEMASVAVQHDGKLLVGGQIDNNFSTGKDLVVVRLEDDGDVDPTFGTAGIVTASPDQFSRASSLAIQDDDAIVVGHYEGVMRLTPNGGLDPTFGTGGNAAVTVGSFVALQPDGKIVTAGSYCPANACVFALMRLDTDGTPDTSFGGTGLVTTPLIPPVWSVFAGYFGPRALTLAPGGKIVVAGDYHYAGGRHPIVARYESSGTLDATFGNGGWLSTRFAHHGFGENETAMGLVIQADEKTVVAVDSGYAEGLMLARFNDVGSANACDTEPAAGCLDLWGTASLIVDERTAGREKLKLKAARNFSNNGYPIDLASFGNPISPGGTSYTMCVYDELGGIVAEMEVDRAGAQCGSAACWTHPNAKPVYRYRDPSASASGFMDLQLFGGEAKKGMVKLQALNNVAKGMTSMPTGMAAGLTSSASATVQIFGSDAYSCIGIPLGVVKTNGGGLFKASK